MPGYKLKDLTYTVSFPQGPTFRKGSGRSKAFGAAADFAQMITISAFDFGVKRRVDKKLREMYPAIKNALGNHTGVMVVVQYHQDKAGAPDFNPPKMLSVMIGPAASNLLSAIRKWEQSSKLMQGPGEGMVLGPRKYLWFRKDSEKREKIEKSEVLNLRK